MTDFHISIDNSTSILDNPSASHNRWHPDVPPAVQIDDGDRVTIETRDSFDGQIAPHTTVADFGRISLNRAHPLTGPVYVRGAEPGDLLAVHIEDVIPARHGFTVILPGFGFLRDLFTQPALIHWEMVDGYARSEQLPGVRIPGAPFMGVMGTAPSHDLLKRILARERDLHARGGAVFLPEPQEAVPPDHVLRDALRTVAPHECGGNVDIKHLVAGTTLYLPVFAPGGLFSTGDAHFAQGDGESCGTAVETSATLVARFEILKREAERRGQNDPSFSCTDARALAKQAARPYYATTGTSIRRDGGNESENVTLAARNALINMLDYIGQAYSMSREQAYCLASVAVDLRISQLVDVPNPTVSAFLPLDIFE